MLFACLALARAVTRDSHEQSRSCGGNSFPTEESTEGPSEKDLCFFGREARKWVTK